MHLNVGTNMTRSDPQEKYAKVPSLKR